MAGERVYIIDDNEADLSPETRRAIRRYLENHLFNDDSPMNGVPQAAD